MLLNLLPFLSDSAIKGQKIYFDISLRPRTGEPGDYERAQIFWKDRVLTLTMAGLTSPMFGFFTCVTVNVVRGIAYRAHPVKMVSDRSTSVQSVAEHMLLSQHQTMAQHTLHIVCQLGPQSRHKLADIFANFIRRFKSKQMEVAQHIIVISEELQVQFGQSQALLSGVAH